MNCLKEGLRNTSAGTVDYTDGADVRPPQRAISYEVRSPQIFSLWVVHDQIDRFLDNITINASRDDYSLTFKFDVRDYSYNENFDDIIKVIEDKGSKAYNVFFDNKKYNVIFNYGWEREIKKMYVENIRIDWKRLYILIDLDYANN